MSRRVRPAKAKAPRVWTAAAVRALGVRTDLRTAASILGIAEGTAYRQAQAGTLPVPVLRLGGRWVVPMQPILDLLGIAEDTARRTRAARPPLAVVPDPGRAAS
jgi:hypothetical protein